MLAIREKLLFQNLKLNDTLLSACQSAVFRYDIKWVQRDILQYLNPVLETYVLTCSPTESLVRGVQIYSERCALGDLPCTQTF
jgi:hypothetical protein